MDKHKFLTPEWIEAAHQLREEMGDEVPPPAHSVRMNQVITEVPADVAEGDVNAYMNTADGEMDMGLGELENPDLTVTLDYATAKAILVDGNPQAGMQAFMAGKIKVQGDMTKLMAMQSGPVDASAAKLSEAIAAMTEEIEPAEGA
ncbi:MAG: SCP2 sterol-binding domain-containing protein [Microthrixaceae bacterium]